MIRSAAWPAAASSPSLRRIVLTSGARSRPSTRPSAAGRHPGGALGPRLPGQRQEHQRQQRRGQPVEPVLEPAVDLPGGVQQAGALQRGQRQQQPGQRIPGARGEHRLGALAQQPPPGQRPLPVPGNRVRQHRNRRARASSSSPATRPALSAVAAGRPRAATRPSALRTLNVDTPVAAAISPQRRPRRVQFPAIRAASSGVSFEAPFGPRRAGTSPATPPAASA